MCAVLSQANNHKEALKHAKIAAQICEDNIIKTQMLKEIISIEEFKGEEKIEDCSKVVEHLFQSIIKTKKNNTQNVPKFLNTKDIEKFLNNTDDLKITVRNILGVKKNDDWANFLNIGNIMYLSAINSEDLDLDSEPYFELLRDAIIEKVVMLTVSYFCLATEIRFLKDENPKGKSNICGEYSNQYSEFWHANSVEYACSYLPCTCPIVKHYISSYHKHYGNNLQIIPENEIINTKIEIIKMEESDPVMFIRSIPYEDIRNSKLNIDDNDATNNNTAELLTNRKKELPKFHLDLNNINQRIEKELNESELERCNSVKNFIEFNTCRVKREEINLNTIICKNVEKKPQTDRGGISYKNTKIDNLFKKSYLKSPRLTNHQLPKVLVKDDKSASKYENFMKIKKLKNIKTPRNFTTRTSEEKKFKIIKNQNPEVCNSPINEFLKTKNTPRQTTINNSTSRREFSPLNTKDSVKKVIKGVNGGCLNNSNNITSPNHQNNKQPPTIKEIKNTLNGISSSTFQKYNTNFSLLNQKYGEFLSSNFPLIRKFNQSLQKKLKGLEYSTADNSSTLSKTKNKILLNQDNISAALQNSIQNTDESLTKRKELCKSRERVVIESKKNVFYKMINNRLTRPITKEIF
jgi:hypothetical protein